MKPVRVRPYARRRARTIIIKDRERGEDQYFHVVRGKRRLCSLLPTPGGDAYRHYCGSLVVALTIPTLHGPDVLRIRTIDHAYRVEDVMKDLKVRAEHENIGQGDFKPETPSWSDEPSRPIDWLLRDLGVPEAEHGILSDYAEYLVRLKKR